MKRFDVVVVGSGISSLTCAVLLAKKGRSVCVLERHSKPGGYLHCFKRFGARFDTGAHYVGAMSPGEPFHTLLGYLGVYDSAMFTPLDPDGFDEFRFPSFRTKFAQGYPATLDALVAQFPSQREALQRYFELISSAARRFPTYEFNDEVDEAELKQVLETPLSSVVGELISDPALQCLLYAYCCLHGVHPDHVSFGFHALVTDSLLRGAYGFRQGGDALAESFVRVIEANGGQVRTHCGVRELLVRGDNVTGAVTDGDEIIESDWFVSGIHPKATFRLIRDASEHFRPAFLQRVSNLSESVGLLGVYAMSRDRDRYRPDRNYYFFASEDPNRFFSPGGKPSIAFAARPDREGSSGHSYPLILHSPGPLDWFEPWRGTAYRKRGPDYERAKETRARDLIAFVDRFDPGLESSVERFVTSTPMTNIHFNGSEEGSAYGIYHSIAQSGARALGPRTHMKNLLLTGQSSLFPGLMGSAISGLRTAGSLIGLKGILRELKGRR